MAKYETITLENGRKQRVQAGTADDPRVSSSAKGGLTNPENKTAAVKTGGVPNDSIDTSVVPEAPKETPTIKYNTTVNQQAVDKYKGADENQLLEGIRSGEIQADSKDATWRSLYDNGGATNAMVKAHNMYQEETGNNNPATGFGRNLTDFPGSTTNSSNPYLRMDVNTVMDALNANKIDTTDALGAYNEVYNPVVEAANESINRWGSVYNDTLRRGADFSERAQEKVYAQGQQTMQMLDDAEEKYNEIESSLVSSRENSFNAMSDKYQFERDLAIEQAQEEKAQNTLNFNASLRDQLQKNQEDRIMNETWAGINGGYGSAMSQRLSTAAQAGINALNQIRRQNNLDNEKFGNNFREIQGRYLSDLGVLTAQKDESIAGIKAFYGDKVVSIMQQKELTRDQKMQQMLQIKAEQNQLLNDASIAMAQQVDKANMNVLDAYVKVKSQQIQDNKASLAARSAKAQESRVLNAILSDAKAKGMSAKQTLNAMVQNGIDPITASEAVNSAGGFVDTTQREVAPLEKPSESIFSSINPRDFLFPAIIPGVKVVDNLMGDATNPYLMGAMPKDGIVTTTKPSAPVGVFDVETPVDLDQVKKTLEIQGKEISNMIDLKEAVAEGIITEEEYLAAQGLN